MSPGPYIWGTIFAELPPGGLRGDGLFVQLS